MNIEPETYEELIRMKRCIELTKYYELSDQELEKIPREKTREIARKHIEEIKTSNSRDFRF